MLFCFPLVCPFYYYNFFKGFKEESKLIQNKASMIFF